MDEIDKNVIKQILNSEVSEGLTKEEIEKLRSNAIISYSSYKNGLLDGFSTGKILSNYGNFIMGIILLIASYFIKSYPLSFAAYTFINLSIITFIWQLIKKPQDVKHSFGILKELYNTYGKR